MFGKILLIKKIKNDNYIFCIFKSKKNIPIFLVINFKSPDNFSLDFNFKKKRVFLSPLEKITYYNELKKINYKNTNIYKPVIKKQYNEYKTSNLKPGFENQYLNFKKFLQNKKSLYLTIADAQNIAEICKKITD